MLSKNRSYRSYAHIYDAFKGDRSSSTQFIKGLIEKYRPAARSILDLACGTGSLEQALAGEFDFVGLDRSPWMLKVARSKTPHVQFIQGDMAAFKLDRSFDIVTCLHNSVNHLLTFERLEQTFHMAATHLHANGLFIFDINPSSLMDALTEQSPFIQQVNADYVITQVFKAPTPGLYTWDVNLLLRRKNRYAV